MPEARPIPALANVLALLSGAVLAWAGYVAAKGDLGTALWISIVPGVTIELAFALVRRADRAIGRETLPLTGRLVQMLVALGAGGSMALAGYVFGRGAWPTALLLVALGGVTINAAMSLGRSVRIERGRFTAVADDGFVVFLIGMRFNKPWKVHKWLLVVRAMFRMLRVVDAHPELGCLGYRQWNGLTTIMVSYWRDFDSLNAFARGSDLPHLEPWRRFNQVVRDSGDVGIWHETYRVRPGDHESLYANMPLFGLAVATNRAPIAVKGETAAMRIGARTRDKPAVAPY